MEEQEALDKKLKSLKMLLTGDNIGLVSSVGEQGKANEPQAQQGRFAQSPSPQKARMDTNRVSSRCQSISSASPPRGSIPFMPSPPPESPRSPTSKHLACQPCRTLYYGPGNGAATTATWTHNKCDSGFFCLKFRQVIRACFPSFSCWKRHRLIWSLNQKLA